MLENCLLTGNFLITYVNVKKVFDSFLDKLKILTNFSCRTAFVFTRMDHLRLFNRLLYSYDSVIYRRLLVLLIKRP